MKKKIETVLLILISGILITLLGIAGCSDMPYTGSMLAVDDVDKYLISKGGDTFCLQNGHDSACLTLTPQSGGADSSAPVIRVHPKKLIYVFYYEGKQIVQAERAMDTTEIVEVLTETSEDPPPQTEDQSGGDPVVDDADDGIFYGEDDNNGGTPPPPQQPPPRKTTARQPSQRQQSHT
ncbi:MAG: hypothetical protein OXC79_04530 [Candidatus Poribacteria bacterium]|nr:hypothetical protein [Candidatus Poribacteria bacterium]